jgi:hypothetical protein
MKSPAVTFFGLCDGQQPQENRAQNIVLSAAASGRNKQANNNSQLQRRERIKRPRAVEERIES